LRTRTAKWSFVPHLRTRTAKWSFAPHLRTRTAKLELSPTPENQRPASLTRRSRGRAGEPFGSPRRLTRWERRANMFGKLYDKADWAVGILLIVAMVAAVIL
jgi:hypothetical protein